MNQSEQNIYTNIRAEQIKHFQDKRNGHLMTKPYPIEEAKKIAEHQLKFDLKNGKLRVTLEELLTYDNDTCLIILNNRNKEFINILTDIKNL